MEALAERLSQLDSHVEGAIRVVAFYDTLMRRRVDLPALARASAGLAECVAGIRLHGTGRSIRVSADGDELAVSGAVSGAANVSAPGVVHTARPPQLASTVAPIILDDEEIGTVWLERPGQPALLDPVLLDRLAIAVAAVVERYGPAATTMADPALVELVVSSDCDEAARARALRLLGFAAGAPVHVVAVRSRLPLDQLGALVCAGRPVKAARVGEVGVILAGAVDRGRFPAGVRAGIGAADSSDGADGPDGVDSPERSWREARVALRFTTPQRPVVHYADLGALALLAEIPAEAALANADVAALARVVGNPEDLKTLDAYCTTGSQRGAADILHLHHSSIARRLDQIGKALGIDLTEPTGLLRAKLALTTWQLLNNR